MVQWFEGRPFDSWVWSLAVSITILYNLWWVTKTLVSLIFSYCKVGRKMTPTSSGPVTIKQEGVFHRSISHAEDAENWSFNRSKFGGTFALLGFFFLAVSYVIIEYICDRIKGGRQRIPCFWHESHFKNQNSMTINHVTLFQFYCNILQEMNLIFLNISIGDSLFTFQGSSYIELHIIT